MCIYWRTNNNFSCVRKYTDQPPKGQRESEREWEHKKEGIKIIQAKHACSILNLMALLEVRGQYFGGVTVTSLWATASSPWLLPPSYMEGKRFLFWFHPCIFGHLCLCLLFKAGRWNLTHLKLSNTCETFWEINNYKSMNYRSCNGMSFFIVCSVKTSGEMGRLMHTTDT